MFEANEQGDADPQISAEELAGVQLGDDFKEFDPAKATPEQVAKLVTTARTALAQKSHWRGKAIDPTSKKSYAELLADARKGTITPPKETTTDKTVTETLERLSLSDEKRTFGHQHKLSPEETDTLFGYAKGTNKAPVDALKDAFFQNGLKATRAQTQNDNATPGPSGRRPVVEGKEWDKLGSKDKRQNFGAFLDSVKK